MRTHFKQEASDDVKYYAMEEKLVSDVCNFNRTLRNALDFKVCSFYFRKTTSYVCKCVNVLHIKVTSLQISSKPS
jgi:hypothetical protein